jgi:YVTN family beta-propeller protein
MLLLLHANEVVSTDRLIDDIWGDRPPRTAGKALQTYVSQLRQALGDGAITTAPRGYRLSVATGSIDVDRFRESLAAGRRALADADPESAVKLLRGALALWRGPAYGEFGTERWARAEVERLEEERLQAIEARIEADLALGRHAAVVGELERLRREHPLREHQLTLLMLALYRCGRQADALEAYRAGRRRLLDELGIEPMPELQALERQILLHDPAISAEPPGRLFSLRMRDRSGRWRSVAALTAALLATGALVAGSARPMQNLAAANTAVLVSANGTLGTTIRVGAAPGHAVLGGGFLWTSNERDGTVSRIDVAGRTIGTIPVGRSPEGIAFVDGTVWVANGGDATVSQIDPQAGKVIRTLGVGNGPLGIAALGPDLWVANSVDGTVAHVDTRSGRVLLFPVGPRPVAVAVGPDAVWVALAGVGAVAKLDLDGRALEEINVGNGPSSLGLESDHVWVANEQDGTLSRIAISTGSVDATVSVGASPRALAAVAGMVWTTLADGRLARIDAHSARVTRSFPVASEPAAVVPDGSSVWVSTLPTLASHRGGTLAVQFHEIVWCSCTDPVFAPPTPSQPLDLVYDGLVAYRRVGGPAGSALVPDLARSIPRPTDGGRTYVFQLRSGVRFSNGDPVRASDVRASFIRLFRINPPILYPTYSPDGGQCPAGGPCDLSRHIDADDRTGTITFHLAEPDPEFLYKLALPFAYVVPAGSPSTMATEPLAGTGPYRIASFVPGESLVLERNPYFHVFAPDATPDGYPDRFEITLGRDGAQELTAVEQGDADVALPPSPLPAQMVSQLELHYASQLHAESAGNIEYMFLNTSVPPFNNVDARRAVNEAVDRARLVDILGGPDAAVPTCQVLPPGFPGYQPYCPYGSRSSPAGTANEPDLTEAIDLIRRSGTRGQSVLVWAPANHAAAATYFAQLLNSLGYRAQPHIVGTRGSSEYYGAIGAPGTRAQIGWSAWMRDYTSADDFIRPLFSCSGIVAADPLLTSNYSRWCDPDLEAAIRAAELLQQEDPVAGAAAWASVDRMIVDRAVAVPYANNLALTLLSRRVGNHVVNPQWGVLLDQLWVR